jgi:hypothetical protein
VLAEVSSPAALNAMLEPMVVAYESWIDDIEKESLSAEIQGDNKLKDSARVNIEQCRTCAARIKAGLKTLQTNGQLFEAFKFANLTMWDQRIHGIWAAQNPSAAT